MALCAGGAVHGLALCAGAGGLELGLSLALGERYRVVGHCERDAYAAAALVARMEAQAMEPAPVWDDLTTFDGRPWRGKVDLISAGFPCQPWSSAGKREGTADERWIWTDIERVVREVRPGWVFLENVPGLVSGGGLRPVLGGLAVLGYDAAWGRISAGELGFPHERARVFVLAERRSVVEERVPDADGRPVRDGPERGAGAARPSDPRDREPGHMGAEGLAVAGSVDVDESVGGRREGPGLPVRQSRQDEAAPEPRGRGEAMADADEPPEDAHAEGRGPRGAVGERGGEVADAGSPGSQGGERRNGRPEGEAAHGPAPELREAPVLPLVPPGPDDLEVWARVLARAPEVEPAICGVADGMAPWMEFRTDRLRALGNGVVPIQAAVAFVALYERLGHG